MQRKTVTLASVKSNEELRTLIDAANHNLEAMGYTEHGIRHVSYVSKTTQYILQELGYDERIVELGAIAGWVHDIGNSVNRHHHGLTGATLTYQIFTRMKMPPAEIATLTSAIGNHEEETGTPVNAVSAALIIADKSDAHRSRVRRDNYDPTDIHDRVNLSIKKNFVTVDKEKKGYQAKYIYERHKFAYGIYGDLYVSHEIQRKSRNITRLRFRACHKRYDCK